MLLLAKEMDVSLVRLNDVFIKQVKAVRKSIEKLSTRGDKPKDPSSSVEEIPSERETTVLHESGNEQAVRPKHERTELLRTS